MFEKIYSKISKRPFLTLCIIISIVYIAVIGVLLGCTFAYEPPRLKTATGTVTKFKFRKETDVVDAILNNSPFFNVTLDDEYFFEVPGMNFNSIDKELFDVIYVGAELTVTYHDRGYFSSNLIYGLEYNGKTYLNTEDTLAIIQKERKTAHTVNPILMGVATLVAAGLILLCYKKVKPKYEQEKTFRNDA